MTLPQGDGARGGAMTKRHLGLDDLRGFPGAWVAAFHAITASINFGRAALGLPYIFDEAPR